MRRAHTRALQSLLLAVSMLAVVALLVASPIRATAQAAKAGHGAPANLPPIEALQLQRTRVFSLPAPNGFRGFTECDSNGDAFARFAFLVGNPMHLVESPFISEVIPDEKRIVEYAVPRLSESKYPHAKQTSYGVSPGGKLYALISTQQRTSKGKPVSAPRYYVERFRDNGASGPITPILPPAGVSRWYAYQIAPFPGGEFLIAGQSTAAEGRPAPGSWGPLTAVYDSAGRFVSEVTLPQDVTNNFKELSTGKRKTAAGAEAQTSKAPQDFPAAISEGDILSGPDGNVWILRASDPIRLYAVDSVGQVVKHFQLSPPYPGLIPFAFGIARSGDIFLDFLRLPAYLRLPASNPGAPSKAPEGPSQLIALLNTISGRFDTLYTLPKVRNAFLGTITCGDGNGGFLYLGSSAGSRLAVFDFAAH